MDSFISTDPSVHNSSVENPSVVDLSSRVSNSKADTGTNASDDGPSARTSADPESGSTQGPASADDATAASKEDVMKGLREELEALEKCVAVTQGLVKEHTDYYQSGIDLSLEEQQKRMEEWTEKNLGKLEGPLTCLMDAIKAVISMDPKAIEDIGLLAKAAAVMNSVENLDRDLDLGQSSELVKLNFSLGILLRLNKQLQRERKIARRSENSK